MKKFVTFLRRALDFLGRPMPTDVVMRSRPFYWVTAVFIVFCTLVYAMNIIESFSARSALLTPLQKVFLYDFPPSVEKVRDLQEMEQVSYWRGAYDWVLFKAKGQEERAEGALFVKIREGQMWRLFSPCVLHANLLHLLFNMIWLWTLGRPVEQRIGILRTLLLTISIGIFSNTLQYLMSGYLFLGYSGVVMGLAGFTWMRGRVAPWEGHPLQRSTVFFLGFFVAAMFGLQLLSFFAQMFSSLPFVLAIANTAHIAGAVFGAWLGRYSLFSWRMR